MQRKMCRTGVDQVRQAGSNMDLHRMTGDETAEVVWDGIACRGKVFGLREMGS